MLFPDERRIVRAFVSLWSLLGQEMWTVCWSGASTDSPARVSILVGPRKLFHRRGVDFASYHGRIDACYHKRRAHVRHLPGPFQNLGGDLIRPEQFTPASRARADGKRLGRAPMDPETVSEIIGLRGTASIRRSQLELALANH